MEQKLSPDGAVIIDPSLAQILAGTKDPVEKLKDDQSFAFSLEVWSDKAAENRIKGKRLVILECRHFKMMTSWKKAAPFVVGENLPESWLPTHFFEIEMP